MPTCRLPPDRVPAGAKDWRTVCPAGHSAIPAQPARCLPAGFPAVRAQSARYSSLPIRHSCPQPARCLPAGFLVGFPPFLRRLSVCCRGFPPPPVLSGAPLCLCPPPGFFVRCLCCLRRGHEKGDAAKSGIPVRAGPVSRVLFPGRCPGPCHLSGTAVTCRLKQPTPRHRASNP